MRRHWLCKALVHWRARRFPRPCIAIQATDRRKPAPDGIVGLAIHRRLDAAAPVMADDHYVPDFEHLHDKLQRGRETEIVRNRQIGDVVMNEHFARIEINNLGRGHPAVGTSYPEI